VRLHYADPTVQTRGYPRFAHKGALCDYRMAYSTTKDLSKVDCKKCLAIVAKRKEAL
jgi:hypothetical protein